MFDYDDLEELEQAAFRNGAFRNVEIDILHEALISWKNSPGAPHTLLALRDNQALAAFALVSKLSGREATYDIRYIVVDKNFRQTGCCAKLLALLEETLLKTNPFAVIRLETSGKKLANIPPEIFQRAGYKMIGHIPAYYGEGDDYYYLIKTVYRNRQNLAAEVEPYSPGIGSGFDIESLTAIASA